MNNVVVHVNHQQYSIICGEGQEQRVFDLAQIIDTKATQIAAAAPHTSEAMILLLSALMLADEIQEMRQNHTSFDVGHDNELTAIKLEMLSERLHQIAQSVVAE